MADLGTVPENFLTDGDKQYATGCMERVENDQARRGCCGDNNSGMSCQNQGFVLLVQDMFAMSEYGRLRAACRITCCVARTMRPSSPRLIISQFPDY